MANKVETNNLGRALTWIAVLVIGLPVLYVLSAGPVAWIFERTHGFGGLLPDELFQEFYRPVIWLVKNNDTFAYFMFGYLRLFGFP